MDLPHKRPAVVTCRLNDHEHAQALAAAEALGLSMSAFVRLAIRSTTLRLLGTARDVGREKLPEAVERLRSAVTLDGLGDPP